MRPEKLTDEGRDRLIEVARLKIQIPASKDLAHELNLSTSYVRQMLSTICRQLSNDCAVPRETKSAKIEQTRETP